MTGLAIKAVVFASHHQGHIIQNMDNLEVCHVQTFSDFLSHKNFCLDLDYVLDQGHQIFKSVRMGILLAIE